MNYYQKVFNIGSISSIVQGWSWVTIIGVLATLVSIVCIIIAFNFNLIITYGDAESHLNIAKRVVASLTPGFAQLGGIWLPLPHILMVPFVFFDPLWRSGLAGSIISGTAFILSTIFLYKLTLLLTKHIAASFVAVLVFITNPNILYMQSTPMTELPLIATFILSNYFFIKFLMKKEELLSLILAGFFTLLATLSRYDGWMLCVFQVGILISCYLLPKIVGFTSKQFISFEMVSYKKTEGLVILFSTMAFFGIFLWLVWSLLIFGDPFYFTHSQFSAKSQQQSWLARGELPAYHNLLEAIFYYSFTSFSNVGGLIAVVALVGIFVFLGKWTSLNRFFILSLLLLPFAFYVVTLYMGQSVIFIPEMTPRNFTWNLFNVRYGLMMVPAAAFLFSIVYYKGSCPLKILLIGLIISQVVFYTQGVERIVTLEDGIHGLSAAKKPDAERWMSQNYDNGLVLMDDYSRSVSIIRSNIPMQHLIYIGNKLYWEESLAAPEKYAKWIIMQRNDTVWQKVYSNPEKNGRLFQYFNKVYTSNDILIFKKIET